MLVSTVRIQNYKSIVDTGWIELEKDITTLLGRNESGKTSFLQAISSFSDDDTYSEEEMCYYTDYSVDDGVPIISIEFEITQSDIASEEGNFDILKDKPNIGDILTFTKFSDGGKELESHDIQPQLDQENSIKDMVSRLNDRYNEILSDIQSDVSSLASQYGGNFRNYINNQFNEQVEQAQSTDPETVGELRDSSQSVLAKIQDMPEQDDEIVNFKENKMNTFDDFLDELSKIEKEQKKIQNYRDKNQSY